MKAKLADIALYVLMAIVLHTFLAPEKSVEGLLCVLAVLFIIDTRSYRQGHMKGLQHVFDKAAINESLQRTAKASFSAGWDAASLSVIDKFKTAFKDSPEIAAACEAAIERIKQSKPVDQEKQDG